MIILTSKQNLLEYLGLDPFSGAQIFYLHKCEVCLEGFRIPVQVAKMERWWRYQEVGKRQMVHRTGGVISPIPNGIDGETEA